MHCLITIPFFNFDEQEQRISSEKFAELQQKIKEYSEMYNAEARMFHMCSKLPPIAENDNLEKEVGTGILNVVEVRGGWLRVKLMMKELLKILCGI